MNCPYCLQNMGNNTDPRFCPRCGHKMERCPKCGKILLKKVKFCSDDGTPIPEELTKDLPDSIPVSTKKPSDTPVILPVTSGKKQAKSIHLPIKKITAKRSGIKKPVVKKKSGIQNYASGLMDRGLFRKKSSRRAVRIALLLILIGLSAIGTVITLQHFFPTYSYPNRNPAVDYNSDEGPYIENRDADPENYLSGVSWL